MEFIVDLSVAEEIRCRFLVNMADNTWIVVTSVARCVLRDHQDDVGIFDAGFLEDIVDQQCIGGLAIVMPEFRCTENDCLVVVGGRLSSLDKGGEQQK